MTPLTPGVGRKAVWTTPFRAPNANAFAERWIGTVRRDCLDWLLIASLEQLERVLRVYVEHYNTHRPHRALGLRPPAPIPRSPTRGPRCTRPDPARWTPRRPVQRIRPRSM